MEQLSFQVAQVEGPLDLILQLVSRHKLNIYDIEITCLLAQYLEAIAQMQSQMDEGMEIASEFLEMAARLVYMKSASLLPKYEETDALKQELTGQLLEYQLCRVMAEKLNRQNVLGDIFSRKTQEIEIDFTYRRLHDKQELLAAYYNVIGKSRRKLPPPKEAFSGIINRRVVSVRSRIVKILSLLHQSGTQDMDLLYETAQDRSELVATFLAVLELMKDRRVSVKGRKVVLLQETQEI